MADVTQILSKIESGDQRASAELLPLIYDELRRLAAARMASERSDHTLQATALVHEAYVRLVDTDRAQHWDSRGHFFSAAAEAMRRILVESARRKASLKRGGDREKVPMADDLGPMYICDPAELIDFNDALCRLGQEDPQVAELVKLRLFAGLTTKEAGDVLGVPNSTAHDIWQYARAWFGCHLRGGT
jgi:RNA polymerase sigma factor (TIGR02999 family)